eukprot:gene12859-15101_t
MKRVNLFQLASSSLFNEEKNRTIDVQLAPRCSDEVLLPVAPLPVVAANLGEDYEHLCNACAVKFTDKDKRNAHYRAPVHRYNLKLRLAKMAPVSEDEFERMAQKVHDQHHHDDSESDSDDDELEVAQNTQEDEEHTPIGGPRITVLAKDLKISMTMYRCVLASPAFYRGLTPTGKSKLDTGFKELCTAKSITWAVLLCGGGRFSGAIFTGGTGGPTKAIVHKTLQRYTTRRKQGGSQAKQDQQGVAGSAGSSIRRYNEKRLREEVLEIINGWRAHFDKCSYFFVFAPKGNTRDIVFPPTGTGPISLQDDRLRLIPFPIIRATYTETQRVSTILFSVDIEMIEDEVVPTEQETTTTATATSKEEVETTIEIKEEEHGKYSLYENDQLFEAAKAKDLEQVKRLLEGEDEEFELPIPNEGDSLMTPLFIAVENKDLKMATYLCRALPADVDLCIPRYQFKTALHKASAMGHPEMVEVLLNGGADPSVLGMHKECAYDLAGNQKVRDVMREWAGSHPDRWDYVRAHIVPLTASMVAEREDKKKAKRKDKKAKDKLKKVVDKENKLREDQERQVAEKEKELKLEEARLSDQVSRLRMTKDAQLTERERRAIAAEQRLLGAMKFCSCCAKTIAGTPFERLNHIYCSTACVISHKKRLESTSSS